jgi:trk system potassium uptake protein TrkH
MALPPFRQQRFTTLAFNPPLHAIFEAISGFTSTGLSMSQDASALPYRLQGWRSFSEWVGGVGAIVLALALIEPSEEHYAFYSADARTRQLGESLKETVAESGSFLSRTRYWLLGRFGWPACHPGKRSIMV